MRAQSRPKTQRGRLIPYLSPPFPSRRPRGDLVTVASVARSDRGEEISPLADGQALGRRAGSGRHAWRAAPRSPAAPWAGRSSVPRSAGFPRAAPVGAEREKKWDTLLCQVTSLTKFVVRDARGSRGPGPRPGRRRFPFPFPPRPPAPSLSQALHAVK